MATIYWWCGTMYFCGSGRQAGAMTPWDGDRHGAYLVRLLHRVIGVLKAARGPEARAVAV